MKSETVVFVQGNGRFITPKEGAGEDYCFVSRLRVHPNNPKLVSFWFTCDNLRKGAALNAFQIGCEIKNRFFNKT